MVARRTDEFMLDPRHVGLTIRGRRTDAGQSRADVPLANETLRAIEVGKALPSLDTAARLADHFGCSIDDLVGRNTTERDSAPADTRAECTTSDGVSTVAAARG